MNQTSLWLEKKPIYTLECLRQLQLVNHLLEEIIYKSKSHPPSRRLFKFDLHLKSGGCTVIFSLESFETNLRDRNLVKNAHVVLNLTSQRRTLYLYKYSVFLGFFVFSNSSVDSY